jgi:hypothetical protein
MGGAERMFVQESGKANVSEPSRSSSSPDVGRSAELSTSRDPTNLMNALIELVSWLTPEERHELADVLDATIHP